MSKLPIANLSRADAIARRMLSPTSTAQFPLGRIVSTGMVPVARPRLSLLGQHAKYEGLTVLGDIPIAVETPRICSTTISLRSMFSLFATTE
jgi:hypothetical protein